MKKLLIANYVTFIFLALITIAGSISTASNYRLYGATHTVTTIINGTEISTRTVSIYQEIFSVAVFVVLLVLTMANIVELREELRIGPSIAV